MHKMQNKLLIVLIKYFICFSFTCLAQQKDSTIEIRLGFVQLATGNKAVTISVINHFNGDIYVPGFSLFAALGGFHCYERQQLKYKEINLMAEMYEDVYEKEYLHHSNAINEVEAIDSMSDARKKRLMDSVAEDNSLPNPVMAQRRSDYLDNVTMQANDNFKRMESIVQTYCNNNNINMQISPDLCNLLKFKEAPIFLKANESIIYGVVNIDHLFKKQGNYKFAFASEPKDSVYFKRSPIYQGHPKVIFPEDIMEYKRYMPKSVVSNVIYLNTKEKNKKKKR